MGRRRTILWGRPAGREPPARHGCHPSIRLASRPASSESQRPAPGVSETGPQSLGDRVRALGAPAGLEPRTGAGAGAGAGGVAGAQLGTAGLRRDAGRIFGAYL